LSGNRRRTASELGLASQAHEPGLLNAITDVSGVRVGHATLVEGTDIRTGVTAVVPDGVDRAGGRLAAGLFVGNGFGKLVGATQLVELGVIETPILLTSTLSAFLAADALVTYMLGLPGNEGMTTVNPIVGETNDGYLSDIRARPVTEQHVLAAISSARGGQVAQGCVGAGTGTAALGFKAGIGTASRLASLPDGTACTVGALVQSNFSGTLNVLGVPIEPRQALAPAPGAVGESGDEHDKPDGNSCMIIVAVDRALDSRQLTRVAKRAVYAMGLVGADFAPASGDYAIAFATGRGHPISDAALGPLFSATLEAVCESVLNSLFLATTTTGYLGRVRHAVPVDFVLRACGSAGLYVRRRPASGATAARPVAQQPPAGGELCDEIKFLSGGCGALRLRIRAGWRAGQRSVLRRPKARPRAGGRRARGAARAAAARAR
jgi:D-aminopeptidase